MTTEKLLGEPLIREDEKSKAEIPRTIFINNPVAAENSAQAKFCRNSITTTKYNLITFIPKNLFEQFQRVANIYFGIISILQLIPGLSPTGRFTTLIILCLVIFTSAVKDAFEDWKRRVSDHQTNNKMTHVLRNGKFEAVKWAEVRVGDIIQVLNKEPFPADILVLASSEPQGLCYVETSQLDGETNLKIKRARQDTFHVNSESAAQNFVAEIECEQPNMDILKFKGTMMIGDQRIALDNENMLLRGSSLRNTQWINGVVIFSGRDTKLMKNRNATPMKRSHVELLTNRFIFFIFALQLTLCLVSTIGFMIIRSNVAPRHWYLQSGPVGALILWEGFKQFFTFLILYNNLIPISLYVSIEVAKVFQAFFIAQDLGMYYDVTDTPATVKTSALNEELGQVEYIFSDKTGTLTCNMMEFLKFSVNSIPYGTGVTEIARAAAKREGKVLVDDRPADFDPNSEFKFFDNRINKGEWTKQKDAAAIGEFLRLLAVCHTVIPETDPKTGTVVYQASSPDEAALVKAAKFLDVEFVGRTTNEVTISVLGKQEKYQILDIIDFTSSRKRMSVICRNPQGQIVLYCKGADTVIYPRLNTNQIHGDKTLQLLEDFAKEGLRTLVTSKAILQESEYQQWAKLYVDAKTSFIDRDINIEKTAELIEKNMDLVGVTAIEDKLQDGVPDCIAQLAIAGIKIWVLTGDKQETAINIGFACDLLHNQMALLTIEGSTREEIDSCLYKFLRESEELSGIENASSVLAMIIEGQRLKIVLEHPDLKLKFLQLGMKCKAVICCRVSPKQKADVVSLVKNNLNTITLAIGDGANDVSMIQAAHVGIGISGLEGLQAANAADYAIAQFRFLKRLLLVHGRWSYRRISKLILYCFYKNTTLYLSLFWFVMINGFSGTSLHEKWTLANYNSIFTAFPIMALAIFDRDLTAEKAEDYPQLYEQGHKHVFFNARVFIQWLLNGVFHSFVCFAVPMLAFAYDVYPRTGHHYDIFGNGIAVFSCVVIVVTIKCAIETSSFTILNHVVLWGSVFSWFAFIFLYGSVQFIIPYPLQTVVNALKDFFAFYEIFGEWRIFISFTFWPTLLLTCTIALLRDVFWKVWIRFRSRQLYYEVQYRAGKVPKEELLGGFPLDEGIPKKHKKISKLKEKSVFELESVKKFITKIGKAKVHRGFAFSQVEEGSSAAMNAELSKQK